MVQKVQTVLQSLLIAATLGIFPAWARFDPGVAAQPQEPIRATSQARPAATDPRMAAKLALAKADQLRSQALWIEAIQQYQAGLTLLEQISDPTLADRYMIAQTLSWLTLTHRSVGGYTQALANGERARQLYQSLGDRTSAANATGLIAGIYGEVGDYPHSLDLYQHAVKVYEDAGDSARTQLAYTLTWIGDTYKHLGETSKAVAAYRQALSIWQKLGDIRNQSEVLEVIANFYANLGDFNQVWVYLNQAKSVNSDFELEKSLAYQSLQKFYADTGAESKPSSTPYLDLLGHSGQKINQLTKLLQVSQKQGNRRDSFFYLEALATTYHYTRGDYQNAVATYQRALSLTQQMGNRTREADSLLGLAEVYTNWGKKQEALDYNLQALAIQQGFQNRAAEADILKQIGDLYASLNATDLARQSYQQALVLFEKQQNRAGQGATLRQLAQLDYDLDRFPEAIANYQRANQISRDAGNRGLQISILTGLSRTYAQARNHDLALSTIDDAIQVARTAQFKDYENLSLGVKGRVLIEAGNYSQALATTQTALNLLNQESKPEAKAAIFSNIGEIYGYLQQTKPALNYYHQALMIWQDIGNRAEAAFTLYKIAKVEYQAQRFEAGLTHINAAITIVEAIRSNIASSELRTTFFARNQSYYKLKIDLLMNLHRQYPTRGYDALALNTSESNRARSLLDILTEANVDIRQGVDPQLLAEEQALQQRLNIAQKQQIALANYPEAKAQAVTLKQEIEQLLTRYKEIQVQIRRASPRYAALTQPKPLTLAEIQSQVLDPDSVLLEYSLGETQSYLWIVTPTHLYSLDLPRQDDIATTVKLLRKNLSARTSPEQFDQILASLSQKILEPAAAYLQKKRLLIVTDGVLRYVPFAALPNPQSSKLAGATPSATPLVVDHEIVHLPSASTLAILRQETAGRPLAPRQIAVFADPVFDAQDDRVTQPSGSTGSASPLPMAVQVFQPSRGGLLRLPGTRQEAQNILELFQDSERWQAFDFKADRQTALDPQLMQYRVLHFATHGILNEANPEFSAWFKNRVNWVTQSQRTSPIGSASMGRARI